MRIRRLEISVAGLALLLSITLSVTILRASDTAWSGEYFPNPDLSGSPSFTREDPVITFDWGSGSPDPAVPSDNFSVRWTRTDIFEAATYRFAARSDDGVRVIVDGVKVIDKWEPSQYEWVTADREMTAGRHTIVVEYYEATGRAAIQAGYYPRDIHLTPTAGTPTTPTNWTAKYYGDVNLTEPPLLTQTETTLDYNWGDSAPASGVPANQFSARWTRTVNFAQSGTYRFSTWSDDGIRLWVDSSLVIDAWQKQNAVHDGNISLSAGNHNIKVEYFEDSGGARVRVAWERLEATGGWTAEFYDNTTFSLPVAHTRNNEQINFDWGYNPPHARVSAENWSARWRTSTNFSAGVIRFTMTVNGGGRLIVDGQTVIDQLTASGYKTFTADVTMTGGNHTLEVQYIARTGLASITLQWDAAPDTPAPTATTPSPTTSAGGESGAPTAAPTTRSATPVPPPTVQPISPIEGTGIIVDDQQSKGVVWGGFPGPAKGSGGYGGHHTYVKNLRSYPGFWVQWNHSFTQAGYYDVYVYIPSDPLATTLARYQVRHNDELSVIIPVDQTAHPDKWVYLGTFYFRRGGSQFVFVDNATGEDNWSRRLLLDAVQFVFRP